MRLFTAAPVPTFRKKRSKAAFSQRIFYDFLYRLCLFNSQIPLSLHCTMNKLYRHFTSKIIGLYKVYKWY